MHFGQDTYLYLELLQVLVYYLMNNHLRCKSFVDGKMERVGCYLHCRDIDQNRGTLRRRCLSKMGFEEGGKHRHFGNVGGVILQRKSYLSWYFVLVHHEEEERVGIYPGEPAKLAEPHNHVCFGCPDD